DLARLVRDDLVVVLLPRQLDGGVALADLQLLGGLGGACAQPLGELPPRRRDDEDQERLGHLLLDDLRALDVDLQDHVAAGDERPADLVARRAIPVAVDLVRLQEAAAGVDPEKFVPGNEVVVDPVDLAVARSPRGAGHDVVPVAFATRLALVAAERIDDRVLPDAGRSRDDDQHRPRRAVDDEVGTAGVSPDVDQLVGHRRPSGPARSCGPWRSPTRTRSSSPGSGASARISWPSLGEVSWRRHAWGKRRSSGAAPGHARRPPR